MKIRQLAVAMCGLTLAATMASSPANAESIPTPDVDPFYAAPDNLDALAPGDVIRKRAVDAKLLGGLDLALPFPGVKAHQILVRSTDAKDRPAAVSATILVPTSGTPSGRKLLSYQPATDSLGAQCEPSYGLRTGEEKEASLMALGTQKGWTVVVPDHQGPRHAFAAGQMAGHAVLDAIRGTLKTPEAQVAGPETEIGMMGYSGGAIATGWAAELQKAYAPELDIVGVASGGTPANLERAGDYMDGSISGGLFVGASLGVAREYPELLTVLNDKGREFVEASKNDCASQLVSKYPFASIKNLSDLPDPLRSPVAQKVLTENRMGKVAPQAPVFLYHSKFDELIPHDAAVAVKNEWCAAGGTVKLTTDYLSEHNSLAVTGAPSAVSYLNDRFAGKAAPTSC